MSRMYRALGVISALSDADAAATLAEFTVQAIVAALRHVKGAPLRWLVIGGGRHNAHFMQRFAAELRVPVEPVEAVGSLAALAPEHHRRATADDRRGDGGAVMASLRGAQRGSNPDLPPERMPQRPGLLRRPAASSQ